MQPAYAGRLTIRAGLPETEAAVQEILSLPIFPELDEMKVGQIAEAIAGFGVFVPGQQPSQIDVLAE